MSRRTVGEILERPKATFYIGLLDLFGRELKGAGYARQKITGAEGCEFIAEGSWPVACAVAAYSAALLGKEPLLVFDFVAVHGALQDGDRMLFEDFWILESE